MLSGVLQHCRLVLAKSIGGCRCVLLEAGSCSSFGLTYIPAWAGSGVGTSAGYVVDMTIGFFSLELVFRMDKSLAK